MEPSEITGSLSGLFKTMWKNSVGNGSSTGTSSWKALCVSGSSGWTLTQPERGEYLGFCPGGQSHSTDPSKGVYVEKEKEGEDKINLKLCSGNCFSAKEPSTTFGIKEGEGKQGDGSEVLFIKKG